jgi:hypothetical protein
MNADRTNETFDALINSGAEFELTSFVADAIWDYYGVYLDYSKLPVECQAFRFLLTSKDQT